jgi:hypothetical protein
MKVAYIAHPISGDPQGNHDKIIRIVRSINILEPDVVPFAPYLVDCLALDDNVPEERERGIKNDIALFKKGFIDEVRLYGDRISTGMSHEIKLACKLNIPIRPMTKGTKKWE